MGQSIAKEGNPTQHRAGQVVAVSLGLAALHSLSAALPVKAAVRRMVGPRYFAGLYRLGYTIQSFALLGWGTWWFLRQPDRELYHLGAPWSWLARSLQLTGLLIGLDVQRGYGVARFLGLAQSSALVRGQEPPATPAGQGAPLTASGELLRQGTFGMVRHPANLLGLLIFWGFPRMTMNRLALAGTITLYVVLGSLHEDYRMKVAYGTAFERYAQEVPFLIPRLRPGASTPGE
jgi:methanethiol S-methyltransferase